MISFRLSHSFFICFCGCKIKAKEATELAMKDNIQLMLVKCYAGGGFPTSGLQSVPGDGEGGKEMTESMQLIREFCGRLVTPEKAARTRIFFPEASEVKFAKTSAFEGVPFKLDYLTKPSFFEDFGFGTKVKMADRVRPEDELSLLHTLTSM
ncbi:putative [LysW]-L-2-aminoadipate/[LysW]-L-glutamate phosphate reductase [Bienertia sinuspersici]